MKKLIMLAIASALIWHFRTQLPGFSATDGAFNDDGSPKAILFIYADCGESCETMVKKLNKIELPYESRMINFDDRDQVEELHRYTKGRNIAPVLAMGSKVVLGYNERDLRYDVAEVMGLDYLPSSNAKIIHKYHFDAAGNKKIVMYGTPWCPYCKNARTYFSEKGYAFDDINVEKSDKYMNRFKKLGGNGYPLIFVGAKRIFGFNASDFDKVITEQGF